MLSFDLRILTVPVMIREHLCGTGRDRGSLIHWHIFLFDLNLISYKYFQCQTILKLVFIANSLWDLSLPRNSSRMIFLIYSTVVTTIFGSHIFIIISSINISLQTLLCYRDQSQREWMWIHILCWNTLNLGERFLKCFWKSLKLRHRLLDLSISSMMADLIEAVRITILIDNSRLTTIWTIVCTIYVQKWTELRSSMIFFWKFKINSYS